MLPTKFGSQFYLGLLMACATLSGAYGQVSEENITRCKATETECINACWCHDKSVPSQNVCVPETMAMTCVCDSKYVPSEKNNVFFSAVFRKCMIAREQCVTACNGDHACLEQCEIDYKCLPAKAPEEKNCQMHKKEKPVEIKDGEKEEKKPKKKPETEVEEEEEAKKKKAQSKGDSNSNSDIVKASALLVTAVAVSGGYIASCL